MKISLFFLFLLPVNFVIAQNRQSSVNTKAITSPAILAQLLTANDTTDLQKVTSIFKWITENIAYNVRSFQNQSRMRPTDYWREDEDDNDTAAILRPLNERVSISVLKRRTAVCEGYSRLFKMLCNYNGIMCEIVKGYGKANPGSQSRYFGTNHIWNAVFIDTAWRLLDATWASGFINHRDEFQKEYNPHYFLTPPAAFILDHYPEDLRWTLLPSRPLPKEFYATPFKSSAFSRNYILSFSPATGVIEASPGDSIVFEIETNRRKSYLWITDIPNIDSDAIFVMQCCGVSRTGNIVTGKKISMTYKVPLEDVEWLNVIYDDEHIMRYKLNIRKNEAVKKEEMVN